MNKVVLVGRLVKDPELRRTSNDIAVVQFVIAVNRIYQSKAGDKQADFISCVVWRQQAENLAKYMRKGSLIGVDGQIQTRTYDDNTGQRKYITEVICDNIHFLESKGTRDGYTNIDRYEIPESKSNYSVNSKNEFNDLNKDNDFSDFNKKNDSSNDEDPFASLLNSSEVSDDDLPF